MGPVMRAAGMAPLALLLLSACAVDRVTGVSAPTAAPASAVRLPLRTCGASGGRDALLVLDGRVLGRAADVERSGTPFVDPAAVTSIEILKGPAALARFGNAAADWAAGLG